MGAGIEVVEECATLVNYRILDRLDLYARYDVYVRYMRVAGNVQQCPLFEVRAVSMETLALNLFHSSQPLEFFKQSYIISKEREYLARRELAHMLDPNIYLFERWL